MAIRTNKQILTGGEKYRQDKAKKYGVDEVVFDKSAREEFLTGFHKRKVERQKKAQAYHKEQERLAKIEARKSARAEKQREIDERLRQLHESREHLEKSVQEDDDEDFSSTKKSKKDNDKQTEDKEASEIVADDASEEWSGFGEETESMGDQEPIKGILHRKQVYEVDNDDSLGDAVVDGTTEVTVESLDNPYASKISQRSLEELAKANNVNLGKADEVLEDSVKRAKDYAILCGVTKPKPKPKKKKFRYLTKSERRDNERRQKLSKLKSRKRESSG